MIKNADSKASRLEITLLDRDLLRDLEGYRANFLKHRRAQHGYILASSGEVQAGIMDLLANEIVEHVLEGCCRDMDKMITSIAKTSFRKGIS